MTFIFGQLARLPRRFVLSLVCLTSACGFQPLMGDRDDVSIRAELAKIRVATIADRSGQMLRNQLLEDLTSRGFEEGGGPRYILEVRLHEPRQEIAIRRDESASRVAYTANAVFTLRDVSGRPIFSGGSSSSSTFEATSSEFASIAGQRSARDRAIEEISANIRQQLAAYFVRTGISRNGATRLP